MPDLGNKHECAECGAKFYDLGKAEPLCPKCGTDARLHQQETKRPAAPEPRARYVAPPAAVEETDEEVVPDIVDEDEEILEVEPGEVEEEDDDDEE